MELFFMHDQVAPLFGVKVAVLALERSILGVDPLVYFQGCLVGAGVAAFETLNRLLRLVLPGMLPKGSLVPALEVTLCALECVFCAVFELDVGFQVPLHGTAVFTELTFVRFLSGVDTHVSLQVGVDFEFCFTKMALKRSISSVGAEVHSELAGVAAGVGADLALKGALVVVNPKVLLEAAAVCCCIAAIFTFVRLLPGVRATVHRQLILSTEQLAAYITLEWLLACVSF